MSPQTPLKSWRKAALVAGVVVALLAIGVLDVVTGVAPDLTILYLLPLLFATYFLGPRAGFAAAALAVLTQTTALRLSDVIWLRALLDGTLHALVFGLVVAGTDRVLTELRAVQRLEALRDLDLESARRAHANVMRPTETARADVDVASRVRFMREIGGDYVWFADLAESRSFLAVADISGKGVVAALFTALLDQSVRTAATHADDLTQVVRRVNRRIADVVPSDMFVTMFAAQLDGDLLSWTDAGHEPALLWRRRTGKVEELRTEGCLPLGVDAEMTAEAASTPLDTGDVLLVVTDGVTESRNFRSLGREALVEVLANAAAAGSSAGSIVDAVWQAASADADDLTDDVAVVCLRYRGTAETAADEAGREGAPPGSRGAPVTGHRAGQ